VYGRYNSRRRLRTAGWRVLVLIVLVASQALGGPAQSSALMAARAASRAAAPASAPAASRSHSSRAAQTRAADSCSGLASCVTLSQAAGPDPLLGGQVTYDVAISNAGADPSDYGYNYVITDTLPLSVTFVSASLQTTALGSSQISPSSITSSGGITTTVFSDVNDLAPGQEDHLLVTGVLQVPPDIVLTSTLTNTVSGAISADPRQSATIPLTAPVATNQVRAIRTIVTPEPVTCGYPTGVDDWPFHYKLTVQNNDVDATDGITAVATLPDGLQYVASSSTPLAPAVTFDPPSGTTTLTYTNISLGPSGSQDIIIGVTIPYTYTDTQHNVIPDDTNMTVSMTAAGLLQTYPYSNSAPLLITSAVGQGSHHAKFVTLCKNLAESPLQTGQTLHYTIDGSVSQYYTGSTIVLTDTVPNGQEYVAGSAVLADTTVSGPNGANPLTDTSIISDTSNVPPSYSASEGTTLVRWDIPGTLAAGSTFSITFQTTVDNYYYHNLALNQPVVAVDSMTNVVNDTYSAASIASLAISNGSNSAAASSAGASIPPPQFSKAITGIGPSGNLANLQVVSGDVITYTLSFTGTGQADMNNIAIYDFYPVGATVLPNTFIYTGSYTGTVAPTYITANDIPYAVEWDLGYGSSPRVFPKGQTWSVTFGVQVPIETQGTVLTNLGKMSGTDTLGNAYSLRDSKDVTVIEPNLTLSKTSVQSSLSPGGTGEFILNLANAPAPGSSVSPAYNVVITDTLPPGMRSIAPSGLTVTPPDPGLTAAYDPPSGTLLITPSAPIAPGGSLQVDYDATLDPDLAAGTSYTNVVTATYSDQATNGQSLQTPQASSIVTVNPIGVTKDEVSALSAAHDLQPGETGLFTMTFTVPMSTSNNLTAQDTLPTDLICDAAGDVHGQTGFEPTPSGSLTPTGTCDGHTGGSTITWSPGTILAGSSDSTYVITMTAHLSTSPAQSSDTNTFGVSWTDGQGGLHTPSASLTIHVRQPNPTLTKSVLQTGPSTLVYTLTPGNTGDGISYDNVITDTLPFAPLAESATIGGVDYTPNDDSSGHLGFSLPDMVAHSTGPTVVLTLTTTTPFSDTAAEILNNATLTGYSLPADQAPNGRKTYAASANAPLQTDLQVTSAITGPNPASPGSVYHTLPFTLTDTVLNNSGTPGYAPEFTQEIPDGATVGPNFSAPSGWTCPDISEGSGGPIACDRIGGSEVFGSGASSTFTIPLTDSTAVAGDTLPMTATVQENTPDSNMPNNAAPLDPTVLPVADLQVLKTVSDTTPNKNEVISYTVTLQNLGPDQATGVLVSEPYTSTANFTSPTYSISTGIYTPSTGVWNVGSINPGDPQTLLITGTVTSPAAYTNTASVAHSDVFDPNATNNSASATNTPKITDLGVAKSVDNHYPELGSNVTFTVTATNHGNLDATGVTVNDLLPSSGLTYVDSTTATGTYTPSTGMWSIGNLANGAAATLLITATAISRAIVTNTASISGDQFDLNSGNDTTNAGVTGQPPKLVLSKAASVIAGQVITYTLTLHDSGGSHTPAPAYSPVITDTLSPGMADEPTIVSSTIGSTPYVPTITYDSSSRNWVLTYDSSTVLQPNGSPLVVVYSSPDYPSAGVVSYVNLANASASDPPGTDDLGVQSNTATATVSAGSLTVSKIEGSPLWAPGSVQPGGTAIFTLTMAVPADSNVQNLTLDDHLPAGFICTDAGPLDGLGGPVAAGGTCDSQTAGSDIAWAQSDTGVTAFASQTTYTAVITTTLITNTSLLLPSYVNTATAAWDDSQSVQHTASSTPLTIDVLQPHLIVTKSQVQDPSTTNDVTYTLAYTNTGAGISYDTVLTDTLPVPLSYTAGGTTPTTEVDPQDIVFDLGPLASNASGQVTVDATGSLTDSIPPFTNNATIASDSVPADQAPLGTATYTSTGSVTLSTDPQVSSTTMGTIYDLEPFSVVATVSNIGADPSVGTEFTDVITSGAVLASGFAQPNNWGCSTSGLGSSPVTITCDRGGSWGATNGPTTFTIPLIDTAMKSSSITATATIHSDTPDANLSNNERTVSGTVQPAADLSISKTVSDATPKNGEEIGYTIVITNAGPDDAPDVTVADVMPSNLTSVHYTATQGTYSGGVWSLGYDMLPGDSETIVISGTVHSDSPSTFSNTATVSTNGEHDPNLINNTSNTVPVTPQQARLIISKTVDTSQPLPGDQIVFTVTLTNTNTRDPSTVTVHDPIYTPGLASAIVNIAAITGVGPSLGTFDAGTNDWVVTLANGASATLAITGTVANSWTTDTIANTASIIGCDQFINSMTPSNGSATATTTPQQAYLIVTKTVSNFAPIAGQLITFTVTLTNTGPMPATNVLLGDAMSTVLMTPTYTASGSSSFDPETDTWNVPTLPVNNPATLLLSGYVDTSGNITNTITVTSEDQYDPNPTKSATISSDPQNANLELEKVASDLTPNVGETETYTVTLTNHGPQAATNVRVTDNMPTSDISGATASPSAGTTYGGNTWAIGSLGDGAEATLRITGQVTSHDPFTNTATVASWDQYGSVQGQSSVEVVPKQADLYVTKQVSDPAPVAGETIVYTVTVGNKGPDTATGVTVDELNPAYLSNLSYSTGTYNSSLGLWTIGNLAMGDQPTLVITGTVTGASSQSNTANIDHSDVYDPDPDNNSASATFTPQVASLQVSKSVDNANPNIGSDVTYTILVTNTTSQSNTTNLKVTDPLPAGLVYISSSGPAAATVITNAQGTTVTWSGLELNSGAAAAEFQITTNVVGATPDVISSLADPIVNTVSITEDQYNLGTQSASTTINPQAADLAISKAVVGWSRGVTPTINVLSDITFTVSITNNGPSPATNVQARDVLPTSLAYVSYSGPISPTLSGQTLTWAAGSLAVSETKQFTVTAQILQEGTYNNSAEIIGLDQTDPDWTNNQDSTPFKGIEADLGIVKTAGQPSPNVGDTEVFTVTLTNYGPDDSTGIVVDDSYPAFLTYQSAVPSLGSFDSSNGTWNVPSLPYRASATLVMSATVGDPIPGTATFTNTAQIVSEDQYEELDTYPQVAYAPVTPRQADLWVTKAVNDNQPIAGQMITYTVTLGNNGPDNATNVDVHDTWPTGLTFDGATPSQGSYNSTTGIWTAGAVQASDDAGLEPTLTISATVGYSLTLTNTADIMHSDQFDPDLDNNSAWVPLTPEHADLLMSKSVSNASPNIGTNVTYTIAITDVRSSPATNLVVSDPLPTGLTYISYDGPISPTLSSGTLTWQIASLGVGATQLLTFTARVTGVGPSNLNAPIVNTAMVTQEDQYNSGDTSASNTIFPQAADLAITKSAEAPSSVDVGRNVTFDLHVQNHGPSNATGVTVSDTLPLSLSYVSSGPISPALTGQTLTWAIGSLGVSSDNTSDFTVTTRIDQPGTITNTASVAGDQTDQDLTNNTSAITVTGLAADLAIAKSVVGPSTVLKGTDVVFSLVATNHGPNDAHGVVVTDVLPSGLSFVSQDAGGNAIYAQSQSTWTIGTLDAGASVPLTLTAQTMVVGQIANTAVISGTGSPPDLISTNNSSTALVVAFVPASPTSTASPTETPSTTLTPSATATVTPSATNAPALAQRTASTATATRQPTVSRTRTPAATRTSGHGLPATATPRAGAAHTGQSSPTTAPSTPAPMPTAKWSDTAAPALVTATASPTAIAIPATMTAAPTSTPAITPSRQATAGTTPSVTVTVQASTPASKTATAVAHGANSDKPYVTKDASHAVVGPGQSVRFTIRAINPGGADATGVTVTDNVPAAFIVLGATASAGHIVTHGQTVSLAISHLAGHTIVSLLIDTRVAKGFTGGGVTNKAILVGRVDGHHFGGTNDPSGFALASVKVIGPPDTGQVPTPMSGGLGWVVLLLVIFVTVVITLTFAVRRSFRRRSVPTA